MPGQYVRVAAAGTPATITEAKWEKRAEELSFEALDSVRSIAEKWTGTIASLLAIFSIVALIKGTEDITKIEGSYRGFSYETSVIILVGLAVGFGAAATVLAALAAYGFPRRFRFVGSEVRRLYREEATTAAGRLDLSRLLAIASVVLLALAVGLTWLHAKDETAAPAKTLILDANGIRACGSLQPSSQPGRLAVLEKGKKNATEV